MSGTPSPGLVDGEEQQWRRGSLGRAIDKFIAAMKRRDSGDVDMDPQAGPSDQLAAHHAQAEAVQTTNMDAFTGGFDTTATLQIMGLPQTDPQMIEIDPDTDYDETSIRIPSNRVRLTETRARELFEKYGVLYRSPRGTQEPPRTLRRVERSVRIRVQWSCHQCDSIFGKHRRCTECGHRRCEHCTKSPSDKLKTVLDAARQTQRSRRELRRQEETNAYALGLESGPAISGDHMQLESFVPDHTPASIEVDDDTNDEANRDLTNLSAIDTRLPNELERFTRPRSPSGRQRCHECHAPLPPGRGADCQSCSHERCTLCPRHLPSEQPADGARDIADDGPPPPTSSYPRARNPSLASVQRVYKQPRQRVRYTCELCRTVFHSADPCTGCGHERCSRCFRHPPRHRRPRASDTVQSVTDGLAAYDWDESASFEYAE